MDWLKKWYFSMLLILCGTMRKSEKTIRGYISEIHVYLKSNTWIVNRASIKEIINSIEKEKFNYSYDLHTVDKF